MIDRRTLLKGGAGLAIGSALAGCSASAEETLHISLLEGAIPAAVLNRFQRQIDVPVKFRTVAQVQTAFQMLQRWQQPTVENPWQQLMPWQSANDQAAADDLVSLGDYWLTEAIAQELVEPFSLPADTLALLPERWQAFGRRDRAGKIDASGELWGVPYNLRSLVVVYRHSQFLSSAQSQPFSSWQDLLAPGLSQGIALPSHPDIVLSLLHKLQTDSFNPTGIEIAELNQQLAAAFNQLSPQIKAYDSSTALKALINEDVQAVVAWSSDVAVALKRYRDLRVALPSEGSLLSADMWVQPKGTTLSDAAKAWVAFCWQQEPAIELSIAQKGISPIFLATNQQIPNALAKAQLDLSALEKSELLLPRSQSVQTAYTEFWRQVAKQGESN